MVKVLKPTDRIAPPSVSRDGKGSLIVTHTFRADGRIIRIQARRFEDPGPYRVSAIWIGR